MTHFSQTGGLRDGLFNATWSFASLTASRDRLEIRCLGGRTVFPRDGIVRLSKHRGLFSVGLRIVGKSTRDTKALIFWTWDFERLRNELAALGYEVAD
jgi:hypothetical protein